MSQKRQQPLGILLKRIHIAFEGNLQDATVELGVTPAQINFLFYLFENEDHPINQRELERYFHLSNPTVTGILQRMETKGLIRREVNEADGRSKIIKLTEQANPLRESIYDSCDMMEEIGLKGFTTEEKKLLGKALDKVLKNITE